MDKQVAQQAEQLVQSFVKKGMKSSTRNKLGNVWWPLFRKVTQGITVLAAATSFANPVTSAVGVASSMGISRLVNSHVKFLQNMTLSNAAYFGKTMVSQNVPEAVRTEAINRFIKRESPLFTAGKYIKQNPENLAKLANGHTVPRITSLSDIVERKLNRADALARKKGLVQAPLKERWQLFKESFQEFKEAKQVDKTVGKETTEQVVKSTEKATGKEAGTMHRMLEQAAHPKAVQAEKVVAQVGAVAEKPVIKTAEKEVVKAAEKALPQAAKTAGRLPLSPPLVKKISEKAAEKTGAKLATKGAAKTLAKKIPLVGLACGIGFGAMRAFDGDWTGAGLELSSGAASCFPGLGTAASVGIDAALIARDIKGSR